MQPNGKGNVRRTLLSTVAVALTVGIALGVLGSRGLAGVTAPSEHKGLKVESLGVIPEKSMMKQIGLSGHKMQLREITIEPGGQIAKHGHETRPGLVKVIDGTWVEGRPDGEREYNGGDAMGILEDETTVHWFWNRGAKPARALVCDIVPAG